MTLPLRLLLIGLSLQVAHDVVIAQGVEARVASVRGHALISGKTHTPADIARGIVLMPGEEIDTRAGGRVVIELSDGSIVIVQPGSLVSLQDYRNVSSLRELLSIAVGRVRVRINHWGGRPNPYRVTSPTASIAVRGTEFGVVVEPRGDTEVVVYDGVVEVSSRAHPGRRFLLQPGHGVIVRPDEDIFFISPPNKEIGERTGKRDIDRERNDDRDATNIAGSDTGNSGTAADAHERFFQSLVASGETPLPSRFTAFPDSFFDSIENPSYATEFKTTEGRLFLLPSIGGTGDSEDERELLGLEESRVVDYSLSQQASLFVPLSKYRSVVGGRIAFSRDGFGSLITNENVGLMGPNFPAGSKGTRTVDGSTKNRLSTISLLAARRFGSDGRTSIGVGIDYLSTSGSLFNTTTQTNSRNLTDREVADTRSFVDRTRFTLGFTREFRNGTKLGAFYRYGIVSAEDRDLSRTLNGAGRLLNRTSEDGRSSEIGVRWRGSISRQLFFGVEASYLFTTTDGRTRRARVVDSDIFNTSKRAAVGFGLGYVLRPRTVFSFDVATGIAHFTDTRRERATGNLLEFENKKPVFFSLHGAVQADIWRRAFVSGSILFITQSRTTDLTLFPDRFGRRITTSGIVRPDGRTYDRFTDSFGNVGLGWRFTPNILGEYIFSTDFGQTSSRHTFMLRYTFGGGEK